MVAYLVRTLAAADIRVDRLRFWPAAVALALLAAGYAVQCLAWHWIVRSAGGATSLRADGARWCLSLLGKYVPGKVWHGVGRVYLYRDLPRGIATIGAAFVVESLLSLAGAAIVAFAMFASADLPLPSFMLLALALAVGACLVVVMTPLFNALAAQVARRVTREALHPTGAKARIAPFAAQVVAYLLLGCGSFALGAAIEPLSWTLLPVFVGALCVSGLAGIAAFFVPAGLGVRDGAFAWILGFVLSPAIAILAAIAVRIWFTIGDIAAVALARAMLRGRADG